MDYVGDEYIFEVLFQAFHFHQLVVERVFYFILNIFKFLPCFFFPNIQALLEIAIAACQRLFQLLHLYISLIFHINNKGKVI